MPYRANDSERIGSPSRLHYWLFDLLRVLVRLAMVAIAAGAVRWAAQQRKDHPCTRDGHVPGNVVHVAPRVSGPVVAVHVIDDRRVAAGDPLFDIDPALYAEDHHVPAGERTQRQKVRAAARPHRSAVAGVCRGECAAASIGAVVGWYVTLAAGWPQPIMAPQAPCPGASLQKGLMRTAGTLAGAPMVLALMARPAQDQWALIAAMSLICAGAVCAMHHTRYAYAWFMLMVNAALIAADAAAAPAQAFDLSVDRSAETGIGNLVVLTVNGILWPKTGGRACARKLAQTRRELAAAADAIDWAAWRAPRF